MGIRPDSHETLLAITRQGFIHPQVTQEFEAGTSTGGDRNVGKPKSDP